MLSCNIHIIQCQWHLSMDIFRHPLWTPLQMNNPKIYGEITQSPVVLMNTRWKWVRWISKGHTRWIYFTHHSDEIHWWAISAKIQQDNSWDIQQLIIINKHGELGCEGHHRDVAGTSPFLFFLHGHWHMTSTTVAFQSIWHALRCIGKCTFFHHFGLVIKLQKSGLWEIYGMRSGATLRHCGQIFGTTENAAV